MNSPRALLLAVLGLALPAARGAIWTLAGAKARLELDDRSGAFAIRSDQSGRVWQEPAVPGVGAPSSIRHEPDRLIAAFDGPLKIRATFAWTPEDDLEVTIAANPAALLATLAFPGPIATPTDAWNLVLPDSEGLLLPAREAAKVVGLNQPRPCYAMPGWIMPWMGVTDPSLQSGYMLIAETPFDAALALSGAGGAAAPQLVWRSELGRFGYSRSLRYHFFESGGYVAQAKRYRAYVRSLHPVPTLRERARTRPAIDRLVGAVQIYAWADARTLDFARELKRAGIDRAWFGWDPSHPPYPAPGFDQGLKQLGYLAGVYDLYRDLYDDRRWDAQVRLRPELGRLWLDRYVYPGLFERLVARKQDGSPMEIAFSPDVGLMRYWVSTAAIQPYVPDRITRELRTYPHDSVFIDVALAAGPFESYDRSGPMTRRADAADRLAIHRYMAERLGLVVGSEWGADYGVPCTDFMHGLMTLHRYWGKGTADPASPYFRGNFADTERPSMVLGQTQASATYWKYGLGPAVRIPLYELVYHDCTVTSWRWDDDSRKEAGAWPRKDLFNALYGTAPLWNLDRTVWDENREHFVSSYRVLGPVLRAVGYDEMTNHAFLTADRLVQRTDFSSGRSVIANFSDHPATCAGTLIPPGGFKVLELRRSP